MRKKICLKFPIRYMQLNLKMKVFVRSSCSIDRKIYVQKFQFDDNFQFIWTLAKLNVY